MNIPYYYNSGYDDDGVNIYTCLKCGDKIYVRSHYEPNFCPYCGVEYVGEKENIGNKAKCWFGVCFTEKFYWAIEERTVELWGEPPIEPERWTEKGCYRFDHNQTPERILAEKRRYEEECQADIEREKADFIRVQNLRREKDPNFDEEKEKGRSPMTVLYEYRIVRKKEFQRHSVMVRKDIYLKKTGKEFNEYHNRLPYNAKAEITTGIKFLPDARRVA